MMKNKKIGTSILAFLLAAATAAAGAQPVLAADLGTVTDNVPAFCNLLDRQSLT
mgnify:CR=1 FL=1